MKTRTLLTALVALTLAGTGRADEQTLADVVAQYEQALPSHTSLDFIKILDVNIAAQTVNSSDYVESAQLIPRNTVMQPVKFVYTEKDRQAYGGGDVDVWKITEVIFFFQDNFKDWQAWTPPAGRGLRHQEAIGKAAGRINDGSWGANKPGSLKVFGTGH
jgi:hypothetical protein